MFTEVAPMTSLLDIAAASSFLGVSPTTLRRFVARGAITHRRVGSQVRFTEGDLAEYVEACRVSIAPKVETLIKPPTLKWLPPLHEMRKRA